MLWDNDAQLVKIVEWLEFLAKKGKILMMCSGNHNYNSPLYKDGFDMDQVIVNDLNKVSTRKIPDTGFIQVACLDFGNLDYKFAVAHGTGSGRTHAAKLTKVEALKTLIPGCDVYAIGHGHSFVHSESDEIKIQGKEIVTFNATCIMTPGYVQSGDNYADKIMCPSPLIGSSSIVLNTRKKEVKVEAKIDTKKYLLKSADLENLDLGKYFGK